MSAEHTELPWSERHKRSFIFRHLDPLTVLNEILFGLIMVFTFTVGAGVIVKESRDAALELLIAIVGCNIAWGIIDGALFIMSNMLERSRRIRLHELLHKATTEDEALTIIGHEFDESLEIVAEPEERERLYRHMLGKLKGVQPQRTQVKKEDILGAFSIFLLDFLCTIPAVVPFFFIHDRFIALRVSNLLLLSVLFYVGFRWARATQTNPWVFSSVILLASLGLVAVAVALGG